jgi:hypothetical protein
MDLPAASFTFPWDDAGSPPPVAALAAARAELGDTFEVHSGSDRYVFLFAERGLESFYGLAERDASKGLADYRMLLRKLPPELFDGRRTFAHDLFGAQNVEDYLGHLDAALVAEIEALGSSGSFEAFALARRLGHRLGLACWIGPEVALGASFDELAADFDRLDGADSFVHPERLAAVRASDYAEERAALARIEGVVAAALASGVLGGFLGRIAERWADVDEPERSVGVARDVVLLHVATMTNLVAAIGWSIVRGLLEADGGAAIRHSDRAGLDRRSIDAIEAAQRSIMMRTALRPVEVDDGTRVVAVDRGTIIATMVPITNAEGGPWVTTFGHGPHRCPAKRFSLSAMARTLTAVWTAFDLSPRFDTLAAPLELQIGGVGRASTECVVDYVRRTPEV